MADRIERSSRPGRTAKLPVSVVGLHGGSWFGARAHRAIATAEVLVGAQRHLDSVVEVATPETERIVIAGPLAPALDRAAERAEQLPVCILASGDPGFFGITRLLAQRVGRDRLRIFPAPSSVAIAFARLALSWDDARVVSAHGRDLAAVAPLIVAAGKAAVLTSPTVPPETIGRVLIEVGDTRRVAVCSRLGDLDESVTPTDAAGLANGRYDPLSVVVLWDEPTGDPTLNLAFGRHEDTFEHRAGLVTKAEVRAVVLGKLALPRQGVLWDLGAGSGSVAIEAGRLSPGLRVLAVERNPADCERILRNAVGTQVELVQGEAPGVLAGLADPDRVFLGGGGATVLEAAWDRLRPGGVLVAAFATIGPAAAAAARLGNLVQVQVSRGVTIGDAGDMRLAAENPVFVAWGER